MQESIDRYRTLRRAAMLGSVGLIGLVLAGVVPSGSAAHARGRCKPAPATSKRKVARSKARKRDRYGLSGKVNLNTANSLELQLLPGVGPRRARRIIAWRVRRKFRHIWDLRRVRGFGRKTLRRLAPYLTTKGKTTLKRAHRQK